MRRLNTQNLTLLLAAILCMLTFSTIAQVGVNTTDPGDGAILDIDSGTKGLLIPRVDIANLATIDPVVVDVAGEESLLVYNTNTSTGKGFHYWDSSQWVKIADRISDDWTTTGNSGTTPAGNFIGTTDAIDITDPDVGAFAFRTNNIERMRLTGHQYEDSNGISWAYLGIGTTDPGEIMDVNGDLDVGGDFDDWDGPSETIKMRAESDSWFVGVKNDPVDDESDFFIGQTNVADDAPFRISSDDYFVGIGADVNEPQDLLHVGRNSNSTTSIRLDNTNTNGSTSLELYDGGTQEAYIMHVNSSDRLQIGKNSTSDEIDFFLGANHIMRIENGRVRVFGDLNVTGNLSKGGGTFKIDHPLDPENKYLYHSFVESPEMLNVYNGNITTNENGIATIELPSYFSALNKDFKYQLSALKSFSGVMVFEEINGNSFTIKSEEPNTEISWQVTGVRQDPYANENRVIPEVEKEPEMKGKYMHPEAYGVGKEKGI